MALRRLQERCSPFQISSSHLQNPLNRPRNPRKNRLLLPNAAKIANSSEIRVPRTPTAVPKAAILALKAAPWRVPVAVAVASWPLPSLSAEGDGKVSLESIVVAIDDFNNRNPFFVAGVVLVWLVVIPLVQDYYFKKYKPVSAIDAFRKLRDVPEAQLLDIRRGKSVRFMAPPNLRLVGKSAVQIDFDGEDEDGFVREVLARFPDPANTIICVLDNFDDNSLKVAELLFKNGFKEAYAVKGGLRGPEGWQAVQESYLPPSVHVFPKKKKGEKLAHTDVSADGIDGQQEGNGEPLAPPNNFVVNTGDGSDGVHENPNGSTTAVKHATRRPLSPYPNYPDLKPPSSPTPSKPES
ncbi:rhodanese-like domain-containing protein 4A, chloroplastic isoform X2 [Phragmites australis]|uniref:rhodanese-like domain-containing protein 4A, chloroplastic isoform X2 n=1 Tax=Phragmites australis TaxID=29695 RepID=UPI002D78F214|nr:rhodanese-like domain-containing protein 4A, chloroplastic isoform X2 [Phragmites australis]